MFASAILAWLVHWQQVNGLALQNAPVCDYLGYATFRVIAGLYLMKKSYSFPGLTSISAFLVFLATMIPDLKRYILVVWLKIWSDGQAGCYINSSLQILTWFRIADECLSTLTSL